VPLEPLPLQLLCAFASLCLCAYLSSYVEEDKTGPGPESDQAIHLRR